MIRKNIVKAFRAIFCLTGEASCRNSLGRPTKNKNSLAWFFILPILYSCASGEMQLGRQALLNNKPDVAVTHFQRVAVSDPNYVLRFSAIEEGVWTYVGRTQYLTGKLPEARQSFERALSQHTDDYLARLYLGLTLARAGDRAGSLREIESGMKGIDEWNQYITDSSPFSESWDPPSRTSPVRREIQSEIESIRGMISGKEFDWQKLISSCEWLGQKIEAEIDIALEDLQIDNSPRW